MRKTLYVYMYGFLVCVRNSNRATLHARSAVWIAAEAIRRTELHRVAILQQNESCLAALQIFSFLSFLHLFPTRRGHPFRCDRAGLAGTIRLAAVRCPAGLAFDINRQTCDWKAKVENCDRLSSMYPFYFKMWQLSAQLLS